MELDYLVLAAHPDDAELYCGGTLLKMAQRGYRVGVLDLTRGEAASAGTVAEREAECAVATKLLQLAWRHNLGLPDSGLADCLEHRQPIVEVLRTMRPRIVIAPLGPCRHPDHTAVHELARSTHFFAGAAKFPSALPPYRPRRVLFHLEYRDVKPTFVIDISAQFEAKRQAIAAYASQFASGKTLIGSPGFHAMMEARSAYYGGLIGTAYGEPFLQEDMLRLDDPLGALDA